MKIVTAHQSSYLPWLGFFHKIALSDVFVILDAVQFEKNSFSNRNKIKGANGEFWLTVPLQQKGHLLKTIKDMRISADVSWSKKHLKSIESCYRQAPFFEHYIQFYRECYGRAWDSLSDLTEYMVRWFLKELGIVVEVRRMSDSIFTKKKEHLIVELCKAYGGDVYVFGKLGADYADPELFRRHDISIYFQDYRHPDYTQLHGSFVPSLSVMDLLFNCGPRSYDILMSGNISKDQLRDMFKKM